jgi:hypothetical protein
VQPLSRIAGEGLIGEDSRASPSRRGIRGRLSRRPSSTRG